MTWPVPTFMTIRLTPLYDATLVEIFHHGFERLGIDAADNLQGYEEGWDIKHLKALRAIVEELETRSPPSPTRPDAKFSICYCAHEILAGRRHRRTLLQRVASRHFAPSARAARMRPGQRRARRQNAELHVERAAVERHPRRLARELRDDADAEFGSIATQS